MLPLVIANDYGAPDAFELAVPVVDEEPKEETAIFDHEETYRLCQCLHSLFHPIEEINE